MMNFRVKPIQVVFLGAIAFVLLLAACAPGAAATPTAKPTVAPAGPTATRPPAPPTATLVPGAPTPTPRPPTPIPTRVPPTATPAGVVPQYGGSLHLLLPGEPAHHDQMMSNFPNFSSYGQFEVLFRSNAETGAPEAEIATSWEYKDPKTVVFKIRQGVKFHNIPPVNGREMTADDVVYSVERQRTPGGAFPVATRFVNLDTVTALDKYTVQMKLKEVSGAFLRIIAGAPVIFPKEAIDKFGTFKDPNNHIGTGPFIVEKYTPGIGGNTKKNPAYWDSGRPYLDRIEVTLIQDRTTILAAWRTGRLDYGTNLTGGFSTGVEKRDLQRTNPEIEFYSIPNSYVNQLHMHMQKKPFDDIKIRRAIHLAIDRQDMLKLAVGGEDAGHVNGPMSWKLFPGWTYGPEELAKMPGFRQPKDADIAESKKLLAEAGFPNGLTLPAEGCECFAFLNLIPMEIAKDQLRKVGITVNIKLVDQTQWFPTDISGDYYFRPRGIATALEPGDQITTRHYSTASRNYARYNNPQVDKLLDAQAVELDEAKRKAQIRQVQDILMNDLPYIYLLTAEGFSVKQPWVKGFTPTVYRGSDYANTWIDTSKKK